MKLVRSNGRELEVREVSEPIYKLSAGAVPICLHGWRLLSDDAARDLIRDLVKVQRCRVAAEALMEIENADRNR